MGKPKPVSLSYSDSSMFFALGPAIDLNNQGMTLMKAGRYAEADKCFQQSLAIKQGIVGRNTTHCALSLMNLGDNYLLWGKLDEAEAAGKEALKIRRSLNSPEAKYSVELLNDIKAARLKGSGSKRPGKPPKRSPYTADVVVAVLVFLIVLLILVRAGVAGWL